MKKTALIEEFMERDELWAQKFNDDPIGFYNHVLKHPVLSKIGASLPLIGGQSLLLSPALAPNKKTIENNNIIGMKMIVNSVNAAFVIYDTCCPGHDNTMFLKVALSDSNGEDYIEAESVALRLIKEHMPMHLKKYFLSYSTAAQVVVLFDSTSANRYIPFHNYQNGTVLLQPFGAMRKGLPFLITRAVPSGISLSSIINICKSVTSLHSSSIHTLSIFYGKDKAQQYTLKRGNRVYVNKAALDKMQADIILLLNDFLCGVLLGCRHMRMSHGDLHMGNILYDAYARCFVMIDYGKAYIDMPNLKVQSHLVINEMIKVQSADNMHGVDKKTTEVARDLNRFYYIYDNYNTRVEDSNPLLAKWGILFDYAGLCFSILADLRLYRADFIQIDNKYENHVILYNYDILKQWFARNNKSMSFFERGLVMFALIVHALHKHYETLYPSLEVAHAQTHTTFNLDIIRNTTKGFFFTHLQPKAEIYYICRNGILQTIQDFGYLPAMEAALSSASSRTQDGGKKEVPRVPLDEDLIKKLTKLNYTKMARHAHASTKKSKN